MIRSILIALGVGLVFMGKILVGFFHVILTSIYQSLRTTYDELQRDLRHLRTRQDEPL